jgi:MFS superfamily sulfate permease-like transporter
LTPGVVVYRLDERVIFTSASYMKGRVHEAINGAPTPTHYLVFDAESVDGIDASGVEMLEELQRSLAAADITLVVARLKGPMLKRFETTGLTALIEERNFYGSVRDAVSACAARPDPGLLS